MTINDAVTIARVEKAIREALPGAGLLTVRLAAKTAIEAIRRETRECRVCGQELVCSKCP